MGRPAEAACLLRGGKREVAVLKSHAGGFGERQVSPGPSMVDSLEHASELRSVSVPGADLLTVAALLTFGRNHKSFSHSFRTACFPATGVLDKLNFSQLSLIS